MSKTSSVYARIDPETKKKAEAILDTLGVSVSALITMLYKQIIYRECIPFDIRLPDTESEEG